MLLRPALSSHSLGRAQVHDIVPKLDAASKHHLDIELFYEDLLYMAQDYPGGATQENQIRAATTLRALCNKRGIEIICLQPFMHYEGLRNRQRHAERVEEMRFWFQLAHCLRTSLLLIPSNFLPESEVSGDLDVIVADLREVADLASAERIDLAFESLAWGTHIDTWEQAWEIVSRVNRDNFGLCLDTFNIAAKVYADPTTPSQMNPNAGKMLKYSLDRMVRSIEVRKVFLVQVVDGEYLRAPLTPGHAFYDPEHAHPRMSWSRSCRLFYGEQQRGGYLPIQDILDAILIDLKYQGPISAELFNRSLFDPRLEVPGEHALRAEQSFQKISQHFDPQSRRAGRPLAAYAADLSSSDELARAQL